MPDAQHPRLRWTNPSLGSGAGRQSEGVDPTAGGRSHEKEHRSSQYLDHRGRGLQEGGRSRRKQVANQTATKRSNFQLLAAKKPLGLLAKLGAAPSLVLQLVVDCEARDVAKTNMAVTRGLTGIQDER